jgi:hypothetical protein
MTFVIMHKTCPMWEAGALPGPDLIARVGALLGELGAAGVLRAAEGLRASSDGVRLIFSGGARTVVPGPFTGGNELPSGFSIVRAGSLDDVIAWATREAAVLGDLEIDIRPVTEPWDIGMAPAPAGNAGRRYMVLRKSTPATESGMAPTPAQRTALSRLIDDATRHGTHLASVSMRPSARGRRLLNSVEGVQVFDGPFVETKELIAGYIVVSAASLDAAVDLARRYLDAVDADEVDVRELD